MSTTAYDITQSFTTGSTANSNMLQKNIFSVVCRGSWLSLAQAELFKARVQQFFPQVSINVIVRDTAGDKNQSTPLHLVEGKDFFTKDIQQSLRNGEADFALHSMKDVSSEDFFSNSCYAIINRDILNDMAIFNNNIFSKIEKGEAIVIGTSSPRRSNMCIDFLQKALPHSNGKKAIVEAKPVRGNVDTRLQKLGNGEYDGLILAAAGLNRLLQYDPSQSAVQHLLAGKHTMLLPLFDCPPAAGQAAIVAETDAGNTEAAILLKAIEDKALTIAVQQERKTAYRYGFGCSQQFGTFYVTTGNTAFGYAAGKDEEDNNFTDWDFEAPLEAVGKKIFSAADYMKTFFNYSNIQDVELDKQCEAVFISSHKAIHNDALAAQLQSKKIWAAGTRTWLALAKKGLWVNGCADGLGFDFLTQILAAPLFAIQSHQVQLITNTTSAASWQQEGKSAVGTYVLQATQDAALTAALKEADIVFWTSFQQYNSYKKYINQPVIQCCPAGKTATLLKAAGIEPIIFPTIKAFLQWKELNTP